MALKVKDANRIETIRANAAELLAALSERAGELPAGIASQALIARCREITGKVEGDPAPTFRDEHQISVTLNEIRYRLDVGY